MTPEEERDVLDGRLQVAMSEFDEMLLKQQKALEEKQARDPLPKRESASRGGGSGGESGAAGGGGQPAGEQEGEDSGSRSQGGVGQAGDTSTGGSRDAGASGGQGGGGEVQGDPSPRDPRVPKDVGDGRDDDIVARQIREAAMKEDDPELREKLWDEYREYKKSAGS
jgi:hypothetical protein